MLKPDPDDSHPPDGTVRADARRACLDAARRCAKLVISLLGNRSANIQAMTAGIHVAGMVLCMEFLRLVQDERKEHPEGEFSFRALDGSRPMSDKQHAIQAMREDVLEVIRAMLHLAPRWQLALEYA